VLSFPTHTAILRKFSVPFSEPAKITQIVHYESERYISVQPIEKLLVDFHILHHEVQSTRLLVAAIPKPVLAQTISTIESCAIFPFAIDLDIMGLFYTWQLIAGYSKKNLLLLYVQPDLCYTLLLSQGQILEVRTIRTHVASLMEGMLSDLNDTAELNLSTEEQSATLSSSNMPHKPQWERLLKELRRTLLGAPPLDSIYLSGDMVLTESLLAFISTELPIPVFLLDFSDKITMPEQKEPLNCSRLSIALRLSLKALGKTQGGFNFRKGEFIYKKSLDIVQRPLVITLTLLCILTLLAALYFHKIAQKKSQDYEQLRLLAQQVSSHGQPNLNLDHIPYWEQTYEVKESFKKLLEESQSQILQPDNTVLWWVSLFEVISQIRKSHYVTIERLSLGQQEVIFEGKAENDFFFDPLVKQLRNLPWIALDDNGIRVYSQQIPEPKNLKLPRQYKIWIKVNQSKAGE
jgi:Tfp pilus assembly PilM family ATPase